ncbi:group-specific protein [Terribacillus halophilus]|uniref:group-specific protein n=1 Tax=Terribacillus halophilus TaxID=361279 RepID=UPI003981D226
MIEVSVDENEVRKLTLEKVEEHLKKMNRELVFWDRRELERRTCMSWPSIQKEFFFHPEFPKYKVGAKWYFPAEKTRQFLLNWLEEQGG